jgi:hypothetical protein
MSPFRKRPEQKRHIFERVKHSTGAYQPRFSTQASAAIPDQERIMQLSESGVALIKEHEGLRPDAYLCPAKIWTIGYGSTGPHVCAGLRIDAAEAEALLRDDAARFKEGVRRIAGRCT